MMRVRYLWVCSRSSTQSSFFCLTVYRDKFRFVSPTDLDSLQCFSQQLESCSQ
jgi:hypothetical protein